MNNIDEFRILLFADRPEARTFFHQILISLNGEQHAEERVAQADGMGDAACAARIDEADQLPTALERIRDALRQKRPYTLGVIWLAGAAGEGEIEAARQIAGADRSLPLLISSECPADRRPATAAPLAPANRVLLVPRPPDACIVRQWCDAQIERRKTQRQLQSCERELAAMRRELARARDDAEQGARAKNEFLANISHEVRTPMNSILGFSELLMRESLEPAQREKLAFIQDAARSLMRLIENVLDFSRLSETSPASSSEVFCLDHLLRNSLDAACEAARDKGLTLHYQIEEAVPHWLEGDRERVRRILANVLSNAVKFTEQGTVHLRVTLDEREDDRVTLRIVVTDTGMGIPADRQAMIFDEFSQADGSITRRFGGVGLGLALTKRWLDQMGGQIGFRSTAGEGSSFWFTLPLTQHDRTMAEETEEATDARSRTASWESSGNAAQLQPRRFRVLVAEDKHLNRVLIELLLTRTGCLVDLVGNGREALDVLKWNHYDLVFMDVQMPKIDGLEVIRRIRREETAKGDGCHRRVIAVTANAMPGDREKCLAAGADDYLAKPFTAEGLLEIVGRQIPGFLESTGGQPHRTRLDADRPCSDELVAESLGSFDQALQDQDFQLLENCARTLKSLAGRWGSQRVADQAMRIQLAARNRDGRRAAAAIDQLHQTFQRASASGHSRRITNNGERPWPSS